MEDNFGVWGGNARDMGQGQEDEIPSPVMVPCCISCLPAPVAAGAACLSFWHKFWGKKLEMEMCLH